MRASTRSQLSAHHRLRRHVPAGGLAAGRRGGRPTRRSGAAPTRGCWVGSCCRPKASMPSRTQREYMPRRVAPSAIAGTRRARRTCAGQRFQRRDGQARAMDCLAGICTAPSGRHRRPDASRRDTIEAFFEVADRRRSRAAPRGHCRRAERPPKCGPAASRPAPFPARTAVRFLRVPARVAGSPFKATAGLHHAVRGCYPLTYERDSQTATMHGFLNVSTAAAIVYSGAHRERKPSRRSANHR